MPRIPSLAYAHLMLTKFAVFLLKKAHPNKEHSLIKQSQLNTSNKPFTEC